LTSVCERAPEYQAKELLFIATRTNASPPVSTNTDSATSGQELARDLGFLEAYTIGVGTMIGAGIFVLPGIVAENAGPAGMISFLIGGVVSLLTALSLSELATGMPKAGGGYYFVNTAVGSFFGSIVGWAVWAGLMFATAFYMLGFGQYLTYFVPLGSTGVAIAALIMAGLLVGVNYRGVKEAGSLQNLIVILLIGFILVFLAFGVFNIDWGVFRPFNPNGWGAVASTAATVYVTFIGFEVIATSAEEIKNPGRNLPLSMIASVLTPTVFYVLVMLVSTGVLPVAELAESYIPVADVAERYLGVFGALMMVVGAVLATVSSANASILSAARVNFAMGRPNRAGSRVSVVHRDRRADAPARARNWGRHPRGGDGLVPRLRPNAGRKAEPGGRGHRGRGTAGPPERALPRRHSGGQPRDRALPAAPRGGHRLGAHGRERK